jgi:tripartite-type tricarboxylate transporter receptor subunit TctC
MRRGNFGRPILALMLLAAAPEAAAEDFYQGKTVTLVVGFSPGGGFDLYARLLARRLGAHIPGAPAIIVQNMPGVASAKAVLSLEATAAKDGTVIAAFSPDLVIQSLLDPARLKIDFAGIAWLGSIAHDERICFAWHATGIKDWHDLLARSQFRIGVTAPGTLAYANAAMMKRLVKAVQLVKGYPGSAEEKLAIERGELDGECGSWSSLPLDWIAGHKINVLARFSPDPVSDIPASPYIGDLAQDQADKQVLGLMVAAGAIGRPYVLSPAVPAARLAVLRQAFDATMKDADFLADAAQQNLPVSPLSGAAAAAVVAPIYQSPPATLAAARAIIE